MNKRQVGLWGETTFGPLVVLVRSRREVLCDSRERRDRIVRYRDRRRDVEGVRDLLCTHDRPIYHISLLSDPRPTNNVPHGDIPHAQGPRLSLFQDISQGIWKMIIRARGGMTILRLPLLMRRSPQRSCATCRPRSLTS
jgi:hypothetical protein